MLNQIYNFSINKSNTYSCCIRNFVKRPINQFYSDKYIDKIDIYISDTFIATGTCVVDSNNPFYYKIKFFSVPFIWPTHLLSDHELIFIKSRSDLDWGNLYYTSCNHFEFQEYMTNFNSITVNYKDPFIDFPNSNGYIPIDNYILPIIFKAKSLYNEDLVFSISEDEKIDVIYLGNFT